MSTYLILDAQASLDGAQAAEADKYALYEYTAAAEYLHKAREEQGYADFGPSIDFASKAADLAKKGITRAQDEKKRIMEQPDASWAPPSDSGDQPQVIIKKKQQPAPAAPGPAGSAAQSPPNVKIVPIPVEQPK